MPEQTPGATGTTAAPSLCMLVKTRAGCLHGVEAQAVDVEIHLVKGVPGFDIVGLAEAAVRESRVRVRAALGNAGFDLPPRRVVLNLAPAGLRKRGASFDLAIAVALLSACGSCSTRLLNETLLFGELSLSGQLRAAPGLLPQLKLARDRGLKRAIVPAQQASEAALVTNLDVRTASDLNGVIAFFNGALELPTPLLNASSKDWNGLHDLKHVHGQVTARRALEIAAAGHHHLLMVGPPGAGKSMLARSLPSILPSLSGQESFDIAQIQSAVGTKIRWPVRRPYRAPHHTATAVSLIGGGDPIVAGEVTLAHRGVLFLDELPEFGRASIEAFRTVMETGEAAIVRARQRVCMPAAPLVVAAMNPCPCGYDGAGTKLCRCTPSRISAYRSRVSGPILDRFALHVSLPPTRLDAFCAAAESESSKVVRQRVEKARESLTSQTPRPLVEDLRSVSDVARQALIRGAERLGLSMRGVGAALRVSRTIAALERSDEPTSVHIAEALSYRLLDRRCVEQGAEARTILGDSAPAN